jgi:hypothetical protein
MSSANEFLMGSGAASAKFETIGTVVTGTIVKEPVVQQQTDITTGEPKYWSDGKPREQLQVVLATQQRDPNDPSDDGHRALYVRGELTKAVRAAIRASGAKGIEVGGTMTVTYTGNGQPPKPGFSGAKLFDVTYAPPLPQAANAFLGADQPPAAPAYQAPPQPQQDAWNSPAAQAPAFAQQAPATAPVATPAGVSPEALAALQGLTPEQRQLLGIPG